MFSQRQPGYFRQVKKRNTPISNQNKQIEENKEEEEEKKKPKYFQKG